jgi:hypothetical protein
MEVRQRAKADRYWDILEGMEYIDPFDEPSISDAIAHMWNDYLYPEDDFWPGDW